MSDDVKQRIGTALREARESANLKQQAVAQRIGVSSWTISKWESGTQSLPPSEKLRELCDLYRTSSDVILGLAPRESSRDGSRRDGPEGLVDIDMSFVSECLGTWDGQALKRILVENAGVGFSGRRSHPEVRMVPRTVRERMEELVDAFLLHLESRSGGHQVDQEGRRPSDRSA
jgi:transcriptional regulator with XRE-family HTH domain